MHKIRIHSIIRLCLLIGVITYGIYTGYKNISSTQMIKTEKLDIKNIYVPKEEDKNLLRNILNLVDVTLSSPPPQLIPGIIDFKKQKIILNIKLIFLGKEKFVLVNNFLYTIGSMLPDGRIIVGIKKQGIIVENTVTSKKELIKYLPPDKVVLEKEGLQDIGEFVSVPQRESNASKASDISVKKQEDIEAIMKRLKDMRKNR